MNGHMTRLVENLLFFIMAGMPFVFISAFGGKDKFKNELRKCKESIVKDASYILKEKGFDVSSDYSEEEIREILRSYTVHMDLDSLKDMTIRLKNSLNY